MSKHFNTASDRINAEQMREFARVLLTREPTTAEQFAAVPAIELLESINLLDNILLRAAR